MLYSRLHNLLGVEVVSPELSGRWKYIGNVHVGAGVLGELSGRLCGQACPLGAVGGQEDLCGEDAHRGNLLTLYALSLSTMMPSGETSRSFVAQAYSPKCVELEFCELRLLGILGSSSWIFCFVTVAVTLGRR